MKILLRLEKIAYSLILLAVLLSSTTLLAQEASWLEPTGGGKFNIESNQYCLDKETRISLKKDIQNHIKALGLNRQLKKQQVGDFEWPLRKSTSSTFYDYYGTSNFVDHDASSIISDHNCEERSYDGHRGTDFVLWPFPWYQYENDYVEVIAAKGGTIVAKSDGNADANCSFSDKPWNAVFLMHDDGYVTWYGHLKDQSLTSKVIGETVEKGEYLGLVASSGSSTDPHLHFEVYDNLDNLVDPYSGDCNQRESLWSSQRPSREPSVNALLTHSKIPVLGCPTNNETPNLSDNFQPGDTVFVASYFHDQMVNQEYIYRLISPNGSVWRQWRHSSDQTYTISWWYWYWLLPSNSLFGNWQFQLERDGQIFEHQFNYGPFTGIENQVKKEEIKIYPNPTSNRIYFSENLGNQPNIKIYNNIGQELIRTTNWVQGIDISTLAKGIYFIKIKTNNINSLQKILIY